MNEFAAHSHLLENGPLEPGDNDEVMWMTSNGFDEKEGAARIWENKDEEDGSGVPEQPLETDELNDGDMKLTDDPSETCRYICRICRKVCTAIRVHVMRHQMTPQEYRSLYPETEFERKTYHR